MGNKAEVKMSVPVIDKKTTQFPTAGSAVMVAEGVSVVRGLDYGTEAGRGIAIFVREDHGSYISTRVEPEAVSNQAFFNKSSKPEQVKPTVRELPNW